MTILALKNRFAQKVVIGLCGGNQQLEAVIAMLHSANKVRKTVLQRGLHIVEIKC